MWITNFAVSTMILSQGTEFGNCLIHGYGINISFVPQGKFWQMLVYVFDNNANKVSSLLATGTLTITKTYSECL